MPALSCFGKKKKEEINVDFWEHQIINVARSRPAAHRVRHYWTKTCEPPYIRIRNFCPHFCIPDVLE